MSLPKKHRSSRRTASDARTVPAITADDERWFRAVADYTSDWESWHGPDGRLLWVNRAVERITGYSVAECLAMPDYPLPIVASEDRPNIASAIAKARDQTSGENLDFRIMSHKRELRWMASAGSPCMQRRANTWATVRACVT